MDHVGTTGSPTRPTAWLHVGAVSAPASAVNGQLRALFVVVWPAAFWIALAALAVGVLAAVARLFDLLPEPGADGLDGFETSVTPCTPVLDEDEQFVVDLLRANDGRVHQSVVVEASDWSKSKVSRLLSRMERDGHVRKISVGRENVVVLVGTERDA